MAPFRQAQHIVDQIAALVTAPQTLAVPNAIATTKRGQLKPYKPAELEKRRVIRLGRHDAIATYYGAYAPPPPSFIPSMPKLFPLLNFFRFFSFRSLLHILNLQRYLESGEAAKHIREQNYEYVKKKVFEEVKADKKGAISTAVYGNVSDLKFPKHKVLSHFPFYPLSHSFSQICVMATTMMGRGIAKFLLEAGYRIRVAIDSPCTSSFPLPLHLILLPPLTLHQPREPSSPTTPVPRSSSSTSRTTPP